MSANSVACLSGDYFMVGQSAHGAVLISVRSVDKHPRVLVVPPASCRQMAAELLRIADELETAAALPADAGAGDGRDHEKGDN